MRRIGAASVIAILSVLWALGCGGESADSGVPVLRVSGSALGKEGEILRRQLAVFQEKHPEIRIEQHPTPDAADLRHQLYVQWLNAGSPQPDILQLDVIWTPEFAAAGWILPLDKFSPDRASFFPSTVKANEWAGQLFALPWFVDVGMLYYRKDLVPTPPATLDELITTAQRVQREHKIESGYLWQGARYEGLITGYVEVIGGMGGDILSADHKIGVDSPAGVKALQFMKNALDTGVSPPAVLSYHEEEGRLAFQNGRAVFLRNWPYAYALFEDAKESKVAGKVGIAPMPANPGGKPTACLGGGQLAINARSKHPELAYELIAFLTAPEQMRERAEIAAQYPTRPALYDDPAMSGFLHAPAADVRKIIEASTPRPTTPVYTQLSEELQIGLHRALTGQQEPAAAMTAAAASMRNVLAAARMDVLEGKAEAPKSSSAVPLIVSVLIIAAVGATIIVVRRRRRSIVGALAGTERAEARLAWAFVTPALLLIAIIAVFPLLYTLWESLHGHDLRLPWTGKPFVGLDNYGQAVTDGRFWAAFRHTAIFTIGAVSLELFFGLLLALALNESYRGRGVIRAAVLIPWAIPTVVAALVWNFMFQPVGITNETLQAVGLLGDDPLAWFNSAVTAWVPVILSDVWKTTPFVALLLLAGLQNIDDSLYEAARIDGASKWQQLLRVTLPLLKPTIVVALLFRVLDAFRVFDLVYVLTGGGPGTSTEPLAQYTFNTLLQNLNFGYGAAQSVLIFIGAFGLAVIFIRFMGADLLRGQRQ